MQKHEYDLNTPEGVRAACSDPRFLYARFSRIGGPCYSLVYRDRSSPSGKCGAGFVDAKFAHIIPCAVSPTERA